MSRVTVMAMLEMLRPKCRSKSPSSAEMMAWRSRGAMSSYPMTRRRSVANSPMVWPLIA
jgi:hypothetical protein